MNGLRVWFDRLPNTDSYALYVTRQEPGGSASILRADGEWQEYLYAESLDPTLKFSGLTWMALKPLLLKAFGAMPEGAVDTEVRVLREWLAVEQARVEKAFDR